MNDRSNPESDDPGSDAPTDGGILDEYDDAVIAADATGMLAGQRLITEAEIDQGLEGE